MKKTFFVLVLLLGLVLSGQVLRAAATPPADLGQSLAYLRPADATADLDVFKTATAPAATSSLVLDLRRASFNADASRAWLAALRSFPAGKSVCLVLISPATSPELLAGLAAGLPGCVTVGRASNNCHPDVAVATEPDADQRATDALATGIAPATLLAPPSDKLRHDEAAMLKDRAAAKDAATQAADAMDSAPAQPTAAAPKPDANSITPPNEPALADAVLQRAVQIHRGLAALQKI